MADKSDPEVIAYLEGQNAFVKAQTAHLKPLQDVVYGEIKARTQETDMSVPTRTGGYWYYSRTKEGLQYGISVRCPIRSADDWDPPQVTPEAPLPGEQVVLDGNVEAEGHPFFSEELAYALRDAGLILIEHGLCRLAPGAGALRTLAAGGLGGERRRELGLAARPPHEQHEPAGDLQGGARAEVLLDEVLAS